MGKVFENQIKAIKDQGEVQIKTIKEQGNKQIKATESNKCVENKLHKSFDELSYERMNEIRDLSRKIDLNNLTYYFKGKRIIPTNFVGFKAPLHLYRDIFNANIEVPKSEENQKQFKLDLNEITRRNPKKKSKHQIKTIETITNLYESR